MENPLDCFVHPDGFDKGFIVVNGFNIGRYWEVGPQRSLYLPASILKEENEIIIYSETPSKTRDLFIRDTYILAETRTDEGPVTIV